MGWESQKQDRATHSLTPGAHLVEPASGQLLSTPQAVPPRLTAQPRQEGLGSQAVGPAKQRSCLYLAVQAVPTQGLQKS